MAIFGNFKGTTQSEFKIGKNGGSKISTGTLPDANVSVSGDLFVDSNNNSIKVFTGNLWTSIGTTLTDLNVDSGTLFVNSENDTVSIGSTSSNEKLFVNGSMRLGTNPSLKYSGAYFNLQHANGTGTVIRVRDNNTDIDPVFKVYTANNNSEAFKVQGDAVTINEAYTLPAVDGSAGHALKTYGNGVVYWGEVETDALNNLIEDSSPELGGNLDANSYNIGNANVITSNTFVGNLTGTVSSISNHDTDSLAEGSINLYYTTDRANLAIESFQGNINTAGSLTVSNISYPVSDGNFGEVLTTDGNGTLSFSAISVTPAGSNTQVQYNDDGNLAASSAFTFDDSTDTLQTGVVRGIIFEPITDYGTVTEIANISIDFGVVTDTSSAKSDYEFLTETSGVTHDSFSVNALPDATQPGQMIFVSDESGGATMAFSDGANWRRITDRNIVS